MSSFDAIRAVRGVGSVPALDPALDIGAGAPQDSFADFHDPHNAASGSDFSELLKSARPLSSDALMSLNPAVNDGGGVSALQSISDTLQIDKMKMLGMLLKGAGNRDPVDNLRATVRMSDMDMQSRVTSKVIGKTVSAITQLSEPK